MDPSFLVQLGELAAAALAGIGGCHAGVWAVDRWRNR